MVSSGFSPWLVGSSAEKAKEEESHSTVAAGSRDRVGRSKGQEHTLLARTPSDLSPLTRPHLQAQEIMGDILDVNGNMCM